MVPFDFSFNDPPNTVQQVLCDTACATPGVLADPAPEARTLSYDVFSVRHEALFYVDDFGQMPAIQNRFVSRMYYAAQRAGLTFPTPERDLYHFDGTHKYQTATPSQLADRFEALDVFDVDRPQAQALVQGAQLLHFGAGEAVVRQDQPVDALYVILAGQAQAVFTEPEGAAHDMHGLSIGDFFGEVGLLRQDEASFSVTAVTDLDVLAVTPEALRRLLERQASLARTIEQVIESRLLAIERLKHKVASTSSGYPEPNETDPDGLEGHVSALAELLRQPPT